MKKSLSMLLALVMLFCLVLTGCGNTAAPAATQAPADPGTDAVDEPAEASFKIGYITSDPSDGFWKEVLESFQAACDEAGIEMAYQIAKDSAGMRSAYDSLLTQQCDIIVDGYSIEEVANAYAEEAVASGIPFMAVAFNCPVEGAYSYGTSNDGLGEFFGVSAAEAVTKEWDGQIDLIITANAYNAVPAMASRTDKAVETLIATEGYEYLAEVEWVKIDTGLDTSTIGANTSAVLTSHPDAKNILYITCTDTFSPVISNAVADAGRAEQVMLFSCDSTATFLNHIKEAAASGEWSTWYGSIDLQTSTYGYKLLDKVFAIMNGENPEAYTEHGGVMITAANVGEYYPD